MLLQESSSPNMFAKSTVEFVLIEVRTWFPPSQTPWQHGHRGEDPDVELGAPVQLQPPKPLPCSQESIRPALRT